MRNTVRVYILLFTFSTFQLLIFSDFVYSKSIKQKVYFNSLISSFSIPSNIKILAIISNAESEEYRIATSNAIDKLTSIILSLNYFTIVEREKINKVLAEQAFMYSGFVNEEQVVELGKILGADAVILTGVNGYKVEETTGYDKVKDEEGLKDRPYKAKNGFVIASIKLIDVKTGGILFAESKSESHQCKQFDLSQFTYGDIAKKLFASKKTKYEDVCPDNETILNNLLDKVVKNLSDAVLPHFVKRERTLEVNFDSAESGINLALSNQWQKALKVWESVYTQNPTDAAIWANIGIAYEVLSCFEKSIQSYQKAVELNSKNKNYLQWINETKQGFNDKCDSLDLTKTDNSTPQNLEPMIVKIEKDKIYVDLGVEQGLKEGEKLFVFEKKITVHPVTGKTIGEEKIIKAELTVIQLFPQMAICKISSKDKNIGVGNFIMRR